MQLVLFPAPYFSGPGPERPGAVGSAQFWLGAGAEPGQGPSLLNVKWENKMLILQLKLGMSHITYNGKCGRLRKLEYLNGKVEDAICNLKRMFSIYLCNVVIIRVHVGNTWAFH